MSGEAHTPGPWASSKFGFQVLTGDSWSVVCLLRGDAVWEDRRGDYEQKYEWQRQEANARLIAAAPAMLEALKELLACNEAEEGTPQDFVGALERAHAAIRLATQHTEERGVG